MKTKLCPPIQYNQSHCVLNRALQLLTSHSMRILMEKPTASEK